MLKGWGKIQFECTILHHWAGVIRGEEGLAVGMGTTIDHDKHTDCTLLLLGEISTSYKEDLNNSYIKV